MHVPKLLSFFNTLSCLNNIFNEEKIKAVAVRDIHVIKPVCDVSCGGVPRKYISLEIWDMQIFVVKLF